MNVVLIKMSTLLSAACDFTAQISLRRFVHASPHTICARVRRRLRRSPEARWISPARPAGCVRGATPARHWCLWGATSARWVRSAIGPVSLRRCAAAPRPGWCVPCIPRWPATLRPAAGRPATPRPATLRRQLRCAGPAGVPGAAAGARGLPWAAAFWLRCPAGAERVRRCAWSCWGGSNLCLAAGAAHRCHVSQNLSSMTVRSAQVRTVKTKSLGLCTMPV